MLKYGDSLDKQNATGFSCLHSYYRGEKHLPCVVAGDYLGTVYLEHIDADIWQISGYGWIACIQYKDGSGIWFKYDILHDGSIVCSNSRYSTVRVSPYVAELAAHLGFAVDINDAVFPNAPLAARIAQYYADAATRPTAPTTEPAALVQVITKTWKHCVETWRQYSWESIPSAFNEMQSLIESLQAQVYTAITCTINCTAQTAGDDCAAPQQEQEYGEFPVISCDAVKWNPLQPRDMATAEIPIEEYPPELQAQAQEMRAEQAAAITPQTSEAEAVSEHSPQTDNRK